MIEAESQLELVAPTNINIVCFRHKLDSGGAAALKAFNSEIMLRLQEEGIACVSDTTVHGEYCLRAAINNHRTRVEDLDVLVRETVHLGQSITEAPHPS